MGGAAISARSQPQGDKRIILVDGWPCGAVNRVPAANDIRSNMVRGGAAEAAELSPREKEICATIGPELKKRGLLFVGIDVIDGYLTEINVDLADRDPGDPAHSAVPMSPSRSGTRSKRNRRQTRPWHSRKDAQRRAKPRP